MPQDPQIRERIDSGDLHGAVKLTLKEIARELKQSSERTQAEFDANFQAQRDAAISEFVNQHPDADNEQFGYTAATLMQTWGLDGTKAEHFERCWNFLHPAPARPRQETSMPVAKPQVDLPHPPDDQLTAAARALIASVGGTATFKQMVDGLSAKEMERTMRDFVFQRAVETAFPPAKPSILTRGDFVRGSNVVRSAEYAGVDIAAAQAAVAASREAHAQAFANYRPATTTETVNPHYQNPMARKGATPGRKTFTPAELERFERANAARQGQPVKPRAEATREAAKARRDEIEARFRR